MAWLALIGSMSVHAVLTLISSLAAVFMVDVDAVVTIAIVTNLLIGKKRMYLSAKDNISSS